MAGIKYSPTLEELWSRIEYTPLEKYENKRIRIKIWMRFILALSLITFFLYRKLNVMHYFQIQEPSFFVILFFSLVFLILILFVYQFLEFKKLILERESFLQKQEELEKEFFNRYRKRLSEMKERIQQFCAASIGVEEGIYKESYHHKHKKINRISFLEKKYQ